jgi:DNA-binding transcriptional LysR family regulator
MIDRIRALLAVVEEGSVNRAAVRLRIAQPALSRQMKLLESEIGGRLLERETSGVKPTALGHALIKAMRPVVKAWDSALEKVKLQAGGAAGQLRIGYLISAAQSVLTPVMAQLRQTQPALKLKLHDLSPREQIDALQAGELDVAITGQEGEVASRSFHSRRMASLPVMAAVASTDALAGRKSISLRDLKGHRFIGIDETHMPGRNQWMTALCRTAGFKPRFIATADGITNVLSLIAAEEAVTLVPATFRGFHHPGITLVPVSDRTARWELLVLWQRGKAPAALTQFLEALAAHVQTLK